MGRNCQSLPYQSVYFSLSLFRVKCNLLSIDLIRVVSRLHFRMRAVFRIFVSTIELRFEINQLCDYCSAFTLCVGGFFVSLHCSFSHIIYIEGCRQCSHIGGFFVPLFPLTLFTFKFVRL